jgi:zinc transport system permease protein
MALYLSSTRLVPFITPMAGAIIFAVLSAFIIGLVSLKAKQREDTVINAIWAIGMSLGVLFLSKTPGYTDPTSYLFGNILLVSRSDLFLLAALDVIVLLLVWRFYPQIEASAFDEEFARVRGIPTDTVFLVILGITAIAVVLLQTFVGLVMVIAMLTLPAGTAGYLARNLAGMMVFSWIFSSIFSFAGLALSWHYDLPSGAVVVVLSGAVFLGATAVRMIMVRIKRRRGYAS